MTALRDAATSSPAPSPKFKCQRPICRQSSNHGLKRSRTSANPALRGTKHLVAMEKHCLVAKGRSDERTVILVPEIDRDVTPAGVKEACSWEGRTRHTRGRRTSGHFGR